MTAISAPRDIAMLSANDASSTGPSFAAALCGFLSTTAATIALMFFLSSV